MLRKPYAAMICSNIEKINTHKYKVKPATLEFVETIFGVGAQRINAFSVQEARQAFADLGCEVSNKKGENSTTIKFFIEDKGVMKFQFHNPHGQGNSLYDALKPYMKRFLESINSSRLFKSSVAITL
jgi:hypothetical protein